MHATSHLRHRRFADDLADELADGPTRLGRGGQVDRGSTLPVVLVIFVTVMAFAGFAVDVGIAFNYRRQAQTAADAGALAGANEAVNQNDSIIGATGLRYRMINWVKWTTYQDALKAGNPTEAQWNAQWAACSDPGHLTYTAPASIATTSPTWSAGGATQCISWSNDYTRLRVKVPEQSTPTVFARLVGFNSYSTSAIAEVEFVINYPAGGVLPFGLWGNAAAAGQICATNGAGNVPADSACSGGTDGNFGYIDFKLFRHGNNGATSDCGSNNTAERISYNVVMGVDHPLGLVPNNDTGVQDMAWPVVTESAAGVCGNFLARPNHFYTQTGNALIKATETGLITGISPGAGNDFGVGTKPGRLTNTCPYTFGSTTPIGTPGYCLKATMKTGAPQLDNVGLWQYLSPTMTAGTNANTDVPKSCHISSYFIDLYVPTNPASGLKSSYPWKSWTGDTKRYPNKSREHLERCIFDYTNGIYDFTNNIVTTPGGYKTILFGRDSDGDPSNGIYDIMRSPRFGFVPVWWEAQPQSGQSATYTLRARRAVYINTLFFKCNNGGGCAASIAPGEPGVALNSNRTWLANGEPNFAAWTPAGANDGLDAMTAISFVFPSMLPIEARDTAVSNLNDLGTYLAR